MSPNQKIMFHGNKYQETHQVHGPRGFGMTRVNDSNNALVITPGVKTFAGKPNCTSCISIELQVGGRSDPGIKEDRSPIPFSEKYLSHFNIPGKFLVQTDMMKTIFYPSGEVYNVLKKSSTWN